MRAGFEELLVGFEEILGELTGLVVKPRELLGLDKTDPGAFLCAQ